MWLSLGAPKQERFAARLCSELDKGVILLVGAVFNFFAQDRGNPVAPEWLSVLGLE